MPLSINPITSIKPFIRTAVAAGSLLLASQMSSCLSPDNKPTDNEKLKTEQETPTPIDLTKPNLPEVGKLNTWNNSCKVVFKDSLGHTITRYVNYYSGTALYNGIRKYSTEENPYITDIMDFYEFVTDNLVYDSDIQKFNGYFYLVTMPQSEKSDTITSNEYTKLMVKTKFGD